MLRSYLLTFYSDVLEQELNNPEWQIIQRTFTCNPETGSASVVVRYLPAVEKRDVKTRRNIRSFFVNGSNEELDDLLSNPKYRVIDSKTFQTALGSVVIVDYETRY